MKKVNILEGSIYKNLFLFTIPIVLTGVLQLLYNAADVIVVGRYAGSDSLAAVGSTGSITNLLVNLFIGFSAGTNVCVAHFAGMGEKVAEKLIHRAVHTAICLAMVFGVVLAVSVIPFTETLLRWMDTPDTILPESALYMRIIFMGMPAMLIYNFGAAILRASGDSKTPLVILSISGVVNVCLNLILVIVFHLHAAGVGIATITAQYLSAIQMLRFLSTRDNAFRLDLKKLCLDKGIVLRMMRIGIPAGIQGIVFSLSNVQVQSAVNSFGAATVAGNASASNLEGFVYTTMNATYQALITFVGQNLGAGKKDRLKKIILAGCVQVTVIGMLASAVLLFFSRPLLNLYTPGNTEVIAFGVRRLSVVAATYVLCGLMEALVGSIRGMGASFTPMCVSIVGVCGFRMGWIWTVFAKNPTLECLYLSYPVSWTVTILMQGAVCWMLLRKKLKQR